MTLGPRTPGTIVATLRDDGKVDAKLYLSNLKPAFEGKGYSDIAQVKLSFASFLLPGDSIEDVAVEWEKGDGHA